MLHLRAFKPVPVHFEYFLLQPGTNMIVTSMISADSSFRDIFRCQLRIIVVTSWVVKISFRRLGIKAQLLDMASTSMPIHVRTYLHCTWDTCSTRPRTSAASTTGRPSHIITINPAKRDILYLLIVIIFRFPNSIPTVGLEASSGWLNKYV